MNEVRGVKIYLLILETIEKSKFMFNDLQKHELALEIAAAVNDRLPDPPKRTPAEIVELFNGDDQKRDTK